ncbi:MAG: anaerobic glycerol-3-phosphate dehydrogenase subunit B [Desulfovibrio sp.]|nr:anaerobic glycerol-3-phosphate dehydrogenase subunit B [Desulfovibrio sp.]
MNKIADVLVVGSGMAGLVAALSAAQQGCSVRLLSAGMGSLAICGGTIDLLGYVQGNAIADPWQGMTQLPEEHPYRLLGVDNVRLAMDSLRKTLEDHGWPMHPAIIDGHDGNTRLPTIMGTLKPTWLLPPGVEPQTLATAKNILVVSVEKLRDCRPGLVIDQLKRYKEWADRTYTPALLPSPFGEAHRSISALDLARLADRPQTRNWLLDNLAQFAGNYDLILLPPLCGSRADLALQQQISAIAKCPVVEMLSIPPGVGGLRLRDVLLRAMKECGCTFIENATALHAEVHDGCCTALQVNASGVVERQAAHAFVMATGGILGGGITMTPGTVQETVFGIDIPAPQDVGQWSEQDIFGNHIFSHMGIRVDSAMRPVGHEATPLWQNVFFAGRTVGGYDYAAEKSGLGVAIATGWQAGRMAARAALEMNGKQQ